MQGPGNESVGEDEDPEILHIGRQYNGTAVAKPVSGTVVEGIGEFSDEDGPDGYENREELHHDLEHDHGLIDGQRRVVLNPEI